MADRDFDLSEDIIRMRSYLIWQHEGCPHGKDLAHWLRAKAELEAELHKGEQHTGPQLRRPLAFVMPRIPISKPPCRRSAIKIGRSAA